MVKFLKEMLDWSEVWATIIPLIVYLWVKPRASWIRPLLVYLVVALLLSLVIDFTWKSVKLGMEHLSKQLFWWLYLGKEKDLYTLVLYNLGSFLRLLLITWFFLSDKSRLQKVIYNHYYYFSDCCGYQFLHF